MIVSSTLRVLDLGTQPYKPVLELQEQLVEERKKNAIPDTLILVEHEPVYTLGRNARESNIIASKEQLKRRGIQALRTSRGGDVTYHGPGQLVGYPIIDLKNLGKRPLWYVDSLEQMVIRTLADFSVHGTTDRKNRGVWVGNNKIAALGVRIKGHITMHGFAINVHVKLDDYNGIIPCGIKDKGVTSLHLIAPEVSIKDVKRKLVKSFKQIFYHI